ncbi:2863_t:CDS:2 [Diversispora eburnea]|uniref:2863_t:CDS:1 n=1 Tax=Diversispora eburnea TaxID=1213867 RepID=A0A9N9FNI8_9GLOM|nr:2863_t:CDS:2 [Diversispora eburnea]
MRTLPEGDCISEDTERTAEFKIIELDIEKWCPALIDYVSQEIKDEMEKEEDWLIEILFYDVIKMLHPVIFDKMIEERFSDKASLIAVPPNTVLRGSVMYGLNKKAVANRNQL